MMDRELVFDVNRNWHLCLFLLGPHFYCQDTKKTEISQSQGVYLGLGGSVYVKCVLPSICVLELVIQPVVFQERTCTQSLPVRWIPGEDTSPALMSWILILIKPRKWQRWGLKWGEINSPAMGRKNDRRLTTSHSLAQHWESWIMAQYCLHALMSVTIHCNIKIHNI